MSTRTAEKKRLREGRLERRRAAERAAARRRRLGFAGAAAAAVGVAVLALVLLAGGVGGGPGGSDSEGGARSIADVHGLGVDPRDGALYIATHTGLFRSPPGTRTARRVDAPEQDLMGFSVAGPGRFLASGHPGPGQDLPSSLGLIESRNGGRTWRSVSLQGEADLHVLRAAGDVAYAYDGRLLVTPNGGRSWQELSAPGDVVDLAPSPSEPGRVAAATADGLQLSDDGGRSWNPGGLDFPVLLAWTSREGIFAVSGEGTVYAAGDPAGKWREVGSVPGPPAAFSADREGNIYFARADGAVDFSSDGGRSWVARSRN